MADPKAAQHNNPAGLEASAQGASIIREAEYAKLKHIAKLIGVVMMDSRPQLG